MFKLSQKNNNITYIEWEKFIKNKIKIIIEENKNKNKRKYTDISN